MASNTVIVKRQFKQKDLGHGDTFVDWEDLQEWCDRVQVQCILTPGRIVFLDNTTAAILTLLDK